MCGRYALKTLDAIFDEFLIPFPTDVDLIPSFNIAPTQSIPIIRTTPDNRRELALAHWGLIPSWATDPSIGNRMVNARAESLTEKPAFRTPFARRRCLVPADGFYEWKKLSDSPRAKKQPYYIHRKDNHLLAFAALWDRWHDPAGHPIDSCTIITTEPNSLMRPIYDRMPVILPPEAYDQWLSPKTPTDDLRSMVLTPFPSAPLEAYPVSPAVNRPAHNSADCLLPATPDEPPPSLFS